MNLSLLIFVFIFIFFQSTAENCLRFCVVHLSTLYYTFNNNLLDLDPQYCSHIIIDAYQQKQVNHDLLNRALSSLQDSKTFLPNLKILIFVKYCDITIIKNETQKLWKIYEKLDGFYFNFREEKFINEKFHRMEKSSDKMDFLSNTLINFRQNFKNKIIVVTVGPKYAYKGLYDYKVFNDTVDFIALDSEQYMMDKHMQNFFPSKQRSRNNATMEDLALTFLKNNVSHSKLVVYVDGPHIVEEPRIRMIWSSLNNFTNILIDNLENFNNKEYSANKLNNNIKKLEKLHLCSSSDSKKKNIQNLTCYYSLKDDINYHKLSKENYQKCDRIIFHKLSSNYSNNITSEKLQIIIKHFYNLNLKTKLILSVDVDFDHVQKIFTDVKTFEQFSDATAYAIYLFIENYNLDGIELVCEESLKAENLNELITKIRSHVSKEIEISLQVNVFKAEKFVEIMNNDISWVTHKINPLSDAALAIFYQWNDLHEKYGLDLQKVVVKFSPAIWQQNAIFSFPGKLKILEHENPEEDVILNRKYLCLNDTIKQKLPLSHTFQNLPIIFTIFDEPEKSKDKMLKRLDDPKLLLAVISFNGKRLPHDLYYIRYETKEIMEYKIKVSEKYGFGGGFAMDSINDDDFDRICGTSLFDDLIKFIK